MNIGCVIMASGLGKRFGGNKLMHPFRDEPMIRQILNATASIPHRVVVTRHREVAAYCITLGVPALVHDLPLRSDTVRLGLSHLLDLYPDLDGCLFAAADQPCLKKASIDALQDAFQAEPDFIYRLAFGETAGNPVLFPKSSFSGLLHLPEGKGGGIIIQSHPELVRKVQAGSLQELTDADTPEILAELEK